MSQFNRARRPSAGRVLRCLVYCRVSSAGQEDNSSLDTQEASCRAYAAERGWPVVGAFREVRTGAELFERPQLAQLREAARAGEAEVVLAHALDRVSRNQAHLGFLLSEWDHLGVRLELVTEELADTPEGRLLQSVRGFVAEMERLKIKERTQRGVRARAESGKPLVGPRPLFGYRWRDDAKSGLEIDPVTGPIVRRIFAEAARGASIRSIATRLTAEGVPTVKGGGKWAVSTVHDILTTAAYTGLATALRYRCERIKGQGIRVRERPAAERVALPAGTIPALIDAETFAAVQAHMQRNREQATRNNRHPEATLLRAGYAVCGYCGHPLRVSQTRTGPVYRCTGTTRDLYGCPSFSIKADRLDAAVWQRVEAILTSPEIIAREVARLRQSDPIEGEVAAIEQRQREIAQRQQRLGRAIGALDDDEAAAPLLVELKALAAERRTLESELVGLKAQHAAWLDAQDRVANLQLWCQRIACNLPTLTYAEKRDILAALSARATLYRQDHTPRWEISLSPHEIVSEPARGTEHNRVVLRWTDKDEDTVVAAD